ncbi:GntR family transcriptional regulator [Priestia koreensis]|uniref:GntR family transcriptional regulator n=1 Tax=Priestia koreensis TaxID=284581 RepID=UPI001F58F6B0|nr:GntR family transcriptional regulator [Priestia koreensis]UNL83261.1 GntR family transcriptional regulator [Priestia koreensis]
MQIIISNQSKQPIYEQISQQVKQHILKGILHEGDSLPSIRLLAKDLQVSVITTKRAYEELEKEGFIHSVVGKGSFVSSQNHEFLKEKQWKIVEDKLQEAITLSKEVNISKQEVIELLSLLYEGEGN